MPDDERMEAALPSPAGEEDTQASRDPNLLLQFATIANNRARFAVFTTILTL
jgi:hypothetical protein